MSQTTPRDGATSSVVQTQLAPATAAATKLHAVQQLLVQQQQQPVTTRVIAAPPVMNAYPPQQQHTQNVAQLNPASIPLHMQFAIAQQQQQLQHQQLQQKQQQQPVFPGHPTAQMTGFLVPTAVNKEPDVPPFFRNRKLRSGKWTAEEEAYTDLLIELFEKGHIDEKNGCTLRSYLSRKLHCAPMRISKKYAGKGIGKIRPAR